jgi:hypothetical protein
MQAYYRNADLYLKQYYDTIIIIIIRGPNKKCKL